MAFEQNQQDAFNLRNDTESLKRLQAELDKATTSIGAAEAAAEEELAQLKLKNLTELQKERLAQLDRLIAQEEAGIRELATLRLKLSEKQFELRKKEIQKELELAKKAADELRKEQSQKPKDNSNDKKQSTTGVTKASSNKPTTAKEKSSSKANNSELINLVSSIDKTLWSLKNTVATFTKSSNKPQTELTGLIGSINKTLSSLHSSVTTFAQSKGTGLSSVTELPQQPSSTTADIQAVTRLASPEASLPKVKDSQQQSTDTNEKSFVKDSESKLSVELTTLVGSIDGTLTSLRDTVATFAQDSNETSQIEIANLVQSIDATLESLYDTIRGSTKKGKPQTTSQPVGTKSKTSTGAAEPPNTGKPVEAKPDDPKEKDFTDNVKGLKEVDVGHYSFEAISLGFENLRKSLKGKENAQTRKDLNKVVSSEKPVSQESLDIAGKLLDSIEKANNAEKKLREFNEASVLNKRLRAADEEHKLRQVHADVAIRSAKEAETISAKAKDLAVNRQKYIDEERLARDNSFAAEQNKLVEERIKLETDLAYSRANRDKLIAQEEQKLRNVHEEATFKAMQEHITITAKNNDLAHNRQLYAHEEYRALNLAFLAEQNKLVEENIKAEAKLKFVKNNEDRISQQETQKLQNAHITAASTAELTRIAAAAQAEDLKNNRGLYLQEAFWKRQNAFADEQNKLKQALIDAEADRDFQKDPANAAALNDLESDKLRLAHITAEGDAMKVRRAADAKAADLAHNKALYLQEEKAALEKAYAETQNKLVEDRYKTEAGIAYTLANQSKLLIQEEAKLKNDHAAAVLKANLDNIAAQAKANDLQYNRSSYLREAEQALKLGHANKLNDLEQASIDTDAKARDLVNNRALYLLEEKRSLENAYAEKQNKLAEEQIQAEAKLDFVRHNKGLLLSQAEHELRIGHINAEHDAMQALINAQAKKDDLTNNRAQYLKEAAQNLEVGHVTKQNDLTQASINAEAKGKDLVDNRDQYEIEARMARENAFYDERNRQAEELIQLETELAWEKAHSDEILAQELQKKRLGYLKEYQEHQKKAGKYAVDQKEFEKDKARKDNKAAKKEASTGIIDGVKKLGTGEFSMTDIKKSYGEYMGQRTAELEESGMSESSAKLTAQFELLAEVSGNLAQQLSQTADKIGEKQAPIDTRLQGSQVNDTKFGSYWRQLAKDMNKVGAVNPYFKQEDFASNIETLVNKGISFDIKQRAFLMTIQEKIANTFDVADGTLLRLVRIQQEDTTAGRLGMESALNSFLNSMYETSEYLSDVASSVRSSLEEMQALMEGAAGTELEFQVQKWMGSLYSVGMSQEAVQGIAQTFGQIASGDISGLTGSGTGNLLIMAANEAGMSIADILQEGLDAKETNKLMQAMVNYLAEIAETSSDSRVVQQQLANVYGVKASDLRAATNLASSIKDVSKQDLTYSGMLGQLKSMANSMILRTSQGEMLSNVWDNVQYTMGTQMASNPILYLLPKVATLLEDFAGGIDLPFLNVFGFGVDLNTSVAQLMNVASMSGTILGALGPMISGLTSAISGSAMLSLAGIDTKGKAPVIARGTGATLQNVSGSSISESGYIGNSSGDDIKKATLQDAEDSKKQQMIKAKDEESADDVATKANLAVVNIYNLLEEVAHGSQSLRVRLVSGGAGNSAPVLNCNCNHMNGGHDSLGGAAGNGATTNGTGAGINGSDNGNWVLTL